MISRPSTGSCILALSVLLVSSTAAGQETRPTVDSLSGNGEFEVMTYTDFPDVNSHPPKNRTSIRGPVVA